MAEVPTTFTEEGARTIVEEILRTTGLPRNDFHRRRRHVNLGSAVPSFAIVRFEEELLRGNAADARLVDPSGLTTMPGPVIVVMDDQQKWFARGNPAPSGDTGGDGRGDADLGVAMKTGATEQGEGGERDVYSLISCGTWARYIEGTLETDSWEVSSGIGFWDGSWVRGDDGAANGTVTLMGMCVSPVEGMEFKAIFDERQLAYKVISLCCPPG